MNFCDKFSKLKEFNDNVGEIYGTEDFSIYLYSIVKMTKPNVVLDLGTGFGTNALWSALALQENGSGVVHTVDDGREWESLSSVKHKFFGLYNPDYTHYINNLFKHFKLNDQIKFHNNEITKLVLTDIDIIVSDYSHGPYAIVKLLADYIAHMSEHSFIFIDSASTYYPSYHTLESIISYFNENKIPKTILELVSPNDVEKFKHKISTSKFELTHIVENKNRNQNSTSQIKIVPIDIMPERRLNIRF